MFVHDRRMTITPPTVLALDFDGVLCNGLKEYFVTAWRAYCAIWQPTVTTPPTGVAERFYRLRPVVEIGWEMPVLIRAIVLQIDEAKVLQDWATTALQLIQSDQLEPAKLAAEVDEVRDRWIATDLQGWLAEQEFYPGVVDRLRTTLASSTKPMIISTKEKRFIEQLLLQQGLELENLRIYGKETKRPKHQILRELTEEFGNTATFWFIEDRLKTLQTIRTQPDLTEVRLFLADWGYNTQPERDAIAQDPFIKLLSLQQFSQDFASWC